MFFQGFNYALSKQICSNNYLLMLLTTAESRTNYFKTFYIKNF